MLNKKIKIKLDDDTKKLVAPVTLIFMTLILIFIIYYNLYPHIDYDRQQFIQITVTISFILSLITVIKLTRYFNKRKNQKVIINE